MMKILPDCVNSIQNGRSIIHQIFKREPNMSKISLQTRAKEALAAHQKDDKYLMQRTEQQLQRIRRAADMEFAKKGPQADFYKVLGDSVDRQIAFRQKNRSKQIKTFAGQFNQIRKAASETTRAQLSWKKLASVLMGAILAYINDKYNGQPWRGNLLLGLIATFAVVFTILTLYSAKCARRLEVQETIGLAEKIQVQLKR